MLYKEFYKHLYEAYPWGGFDVTTDDFGNKEKEKYTTASDDPKDLAVRTLSLIHI